jgi:hypothetical protein
LATTAATVRPPRPGAFLLRHPADRNAILVMIGLIWAAVLIGFGLDIAERYQRGAATYPAIIYIHGTAFLGWLALLTTQALLIRDRKVRLHRSIGVGGACLAAAMIVLGLSAALTIQKLRLDAPDADPAFLAIQFMDMAGFGALAAAAVSARKQPAAHKRLILLATLAIVDAGLARFLAFPIRQVIGGNGSWQFWVEAYASSWPLILAIGCYDWITRRRVHPAWVFGSLWILAEEITASWLYFNPGWKDLATSIIQLWPWA